MKSKPSPLFPKPSIQTHPKGFSCGRSTRT